MSDPAEKKIGLEQFLSEDLEFSGDRQVHVKIRGTDHLLRSVLYEEDEVARIPMESLPVNLPLPCPLYVQVGNKFIMFRRHEDSISTKRIQGLKDVGADSVYIPKLLWKEFMSTLEDMPLGDNAAVGTRSRHLRALIVAYSAELQRSNQPPKKEVLDRLQKLMYRLAELIFSDVQAGVKQIRANLEPDLYFVNHSVNTAIYGALMAIALKYPLDDVKTIAFGCLVHNIGNVFISKDILHKRGPLTPQELTVMQTHTLKGAEFLRTMEAEEAIIAMAEQHHERVDGNGYPKGLKGAEIHAFAKITAIADVYDAITSNRPHQKGLSSLEAMRRMRQQEGLFDMQFLEQIHFEKFKP